MHACTYARTYAVLFMRAHARVLSQFIFMMYQASMTQRLAMLVEPAERRPGRKEKIGAIDTEERLTRVGGEKQGREERREKTPTECKTV